MNDSGEWTFDNTTDVLTFWNGAAAQQVSIIGVNSVVADGSNLLKVGF